jgi:outer membrane protein assembly factor BamB
MISDLNGVNAVFGYSMPVLVENERLYCFPGGADTNVACLNRNTGKIIWTSSGNGEVPGYAEPLLIRHHDRDLLVFFSEMAMIGLDGGSGKVLWTWELSFKGNVPCNKPVYADGFLYIAEGMGNGAVKFELSDDGSQLKKIWDNPGFDPYFGGFVKIGNFFYGSSDSERMWLSIDAETGKPSDSLQFRTGATIASGNHLILYNQTGKVGLVRINEGKMTLETTFNIMAGTNEHFAIPAVANARLFIRHGDALLVYDYEKLMNQSEDVPSP